MSENLDEIRTIASVNNSINSDAHSRFVLMKVKSQLLNAIEKIEDSLELEYTGDMIALKLIDGKYKFLGFYYEDMSDDELEKFSELEWDQLIPIPKNGTFPEFLKW